MKTIRIIDDKDLERIRYNLNNIHGSLYNIGAPLNDNVFRFNDEQCRYLEKIIDLYLVDLYDLFGYDSE